MNEWCSLWSERCVCSAGLRKCMYTSLSVPRRLVCGAEEIRLPRGAAPGPAQPEPPTGLTPVWFSCRIWRWAWVRWTWRRSRWGRSSGDCAGRCTGWPARDPPPVSHHLKDIIHTFICQKSSSPWRLCHHVTSKLTLDLPRGSPHLGLVSRYERAKVGVVGEITQNPQRAHHSEQTLVVCGFDGWILQSFLGRGRVCGPGHLRDGVDVVRGAGDRLICHLHDHWLDDSCKEKHRRQDCLFKGDTITYVAMATRHSYSCVFLSDQGASPTHSVIGRGALSNKSPVDGAFQQKSKLSSNLYSTEWKWKWKKIIIN